MLTTHLGVNQKHSLSDLTVLKEEIKNSLSQENIHHVTIEFETEMANCNQSKEKHKRA